MQIGDLSLDEIVGQPAAIKQLKNLVSSIRYKSLYSHWSTKPPKGIMLTGPTGVGKTASVRALAYTLGAQVFLMELRYLDIASKWVDMPIEQLKGFFTLAEEKSKERHVIIFIDEIDSMLPARDMQLHETSMKRVNVFLEWMDGGFSSLNNITIIGATNFIEGVDKAAKRPGRFDKIVKFQELSPDDIIEGFNIHLSKRHLSSGQVEVLQPQKLKAMLSKGDLSGADIPELINRLIEKKINEHKSNIELEVPTFALMTPEQQHALLNNSLYVPRAITTEDVIDEFAEYIRNKKQIETNGSLNKFGFHLTPMEQ